jgi:hypothetical protein
MGLSFTIAVGPLQRSHSWVRVPRDSWWHFTVSDSRLPNLEGQVPIFVSQDQDGPVILPGSGYPFRSLLRLAGLQWKYSNRPPHGLVRTGSLRVQIWTRNFPSTKQECYLLETFGVQRLRESDSSNSFFETKGPGNGMLLASLLQTLWRCN